jgi:hypothetical protein
MASFNACRLVPFIESFPAIPDKTAATKKVLDLSGIGRGSRDKKGGG